MRSDVSKNCVNFKVQYRWEGLWSFYQRKAESAETIAARDTQSIIHPLKQTPLLCLPQGLTPPSSAPLPGGRGLI